MKKNDLYCLNGQILRIVHIKDNQALVIDCKKCTMPFWVNLSELDCADCESYVQYLSGGKVTVECICQGRESY